MGEERRRGNLDAGLCSAGVGVMLPGLIARRLVDWMDIMGERVGVVESFMVVEHASSEV